MAVVNGIRIALEREPVLNCPKIAVVQVALVPAASGPALAASCESLVSLALPHATITAAGAARSIPHPSELAWPGVTPRP